MPASPSGANPAGGADWRLLTGSATPSTRATPLALGLELRRRADRGDHQWSPRPISAATPRDLARSPEEILLGVRPLMRSSATRGWIQGDATWDAVRRPSTRFDREQSRWFADLLSIARESLLSGTAGDWLLLDAVESSLLWPHLHAATETGIALEPTQKHTRLALADDAAVSVRLARADDGGLDLTAEVVVDGGTVAAEDVRTIGRTGIYVAALRGSRIELTLAEARLSEPVRTLLTSRSVVRVPSDDERAFFRDAYPALARGTTIRAAGALRLPDPVRPEPVLTLSFRAGDAVAFAFGWSYADHGLFPTGETSDAVRDAAAERTRREELEEVWRRSSEAPFADTGAFHGVDAAEFVAHVVPALEEHGVRVVVSGARKSYRELTGEPEITVTTVESTDPDWFDLGVLVRIDGRTIPFAPLFTALSMRRAKLLLVDGSYLSLAHPALQRLRELLDEAAELDEWEAGPRISRYQTSLWEDFEDLAHEARPAVAWRATAEGLRGARGIPGVPVPHGVTATLRPYQRTGFEWLAFLWTHRLGGILADDMGLGKTLQLLALIQHARETGERRPFLVVAPTSVLPTWKAEAARFAPGLRVRLIDGGRGTRDAAVTTIAAGVDVVVTSYGLARRDEAEFAAVEWAGLILDEAQFVKNPATKLHRAIAALDAEVVFAVTGTPLENSLSELWALLSLCAPGLFPSARRFREEYIQPIERGKTPENAVGSDYRRRRLERLRRRIRPLLLRRTKELVAADLPAKQEQVLRIELSPGHRALYDTVLQRERQKVLGLLADLDRHRFIVFRSLTMLRMLSLSPAIVDAADAGLGSRKIDALVARIVELHAEGHRALVFSQFTSALALVAERLRGAGIAFSSLDGSTRHREQVVDGFRSGDQPVFLISLKAGGFGLTLTEADYVFLLDPWWNPAAELQAIDRTHRIGQTRPVMVYRMIAADTIEEKVLALQQRKAQLFDAVLDDDALFAQSLTGEDIRALFEG